MNLQLTKTLRLCAVWLTLILAASAVQAQTDTTPKKRLRTPAVVRGFIGGEAHDSYVIHARRGQLMTMRIAWRQQDDNTASFTVSKSGDFFNSEPAGFGQESDQGRHWRGKIPRTGNYYIYVVAHPTAHYTLRVSLK